MAEEILLTKEQESLLSALIVLVQELRSPDYDGIIIVARSMTGAFLYNIQQDDGKRIEVNFGDWLELCNQGLITVSGSNDKGMPTSGYVSPKGIAYAQQMGNREKVLGFLKAHQGEGFDDDELSAKLRIFPRQTVNQICRRLQTEGLIQRIKGSNGKMHNYYAGTGDLHIEKSRPAYAQAVEQKGEEQKSGSKEAYIGPRRQLEAYQKIREIIEAAVQELIIEDNYIDRTIFALLSNVKPGAKIRILTRTPPQDFALEASKFRQQQGNLEVRVGIADFHDRFIVADDKCWHLGASIKDAGNKGFAINLLEDQTNVQRIRSNIEDAWTKGTSLV